MQTFNDRVFSLAANDGIRLIFDMKGSRRLYLKVTGRQAYDLFCREMGMRPDDGPALDFVMEMLFTGVSWFGMDKVLVREASDCALPCKVSSECDGKKSVRIDFSTSGGASTCLRIKYDQMTIRSKQV